VLRDVVALVFAADGAGAVAVAADGPDLAVRSTMHHVRPDGRRWSVEIPAANAADLIDSAHPGGVELPPEDPATPSRVNLGVANPGTTVAWVLATAEAGILGGVTPLTVPPRSYRHLSLPAAWRGAHVSLRVTPPAAQVLAHVSVVEQQSGRWAFLPIAGSPAPVPATEP
jgi:hypothetical protein